MPPAITSEQLDAIERLQQHFRDAPASFTVHTIFSDALCKWSDGLITAARAHVRAWETWRAGLPEGTAWAAMDEDGEWCAYGEKNERPEQEKDHFPGMRGYWSNGWCIDTTPPPPGVDPATPWTDTLIKL